MTDVSGPTPLSVGHGIIADSKFEPCSPPIELVERERLLETLDLAVDRKLALVVAPAGFGKSVLMGQWLRKSAQANFVCAWLTLEPADTDEHQFLSYLVLAITRVGIGLGELENAAHNGFSDAPSNLVLAKLIAGLREHDQKVVLILEDYHLAECETVNAIVNQLLRDSDDKLVLFIDSRRIPDLDIASRVAAGEALEIGADPMRLTREETLKALSGVTQGIEADAIHSQTEGWPVAVQLAAAQIKTRSARPVLEGFSGGLMTSYLTEQILSSIAPQARGLLLTLAFLERFDFSLADFVTQQGDSRALFDELTPLRALIVNSDGGDTWMRLHHLFAEYLRDLRIREDAGSVNEIYLRASRWYQKQGSTVEAVKYAAKAEDYDTCTQIILESGGWRIILTDGIGVLRNALRQLPDEALHSNGRLMIARAYLHCKFGEILEARAMLDAAIALSDSEQGCAQYHEARDCDRVVIESILSLYEDRVDLGSDYDQLRSRFFEQDLLEPLDRGTLFCELVAERTAEGDFVEASTALHEAFAAMRQSGSVLGLNYCYIHAALIALYRGEMDMATANVNRALRMAEENFGSDSGLKNLAVLLRCAVRAWQGEAQSNEMSVLRAALQHTMDYDGWVEIYMAGIDALLLLGDQTDSQGAVEATLRDMLLFSKRRQLKRLTCYGEHQLNQLRRENPDTLSPIPQDERYWKCRLVRERARLYATTSDTQSGSLETRDTSDVEMDRSGLLALAWRIELASLHNSKQEISECVRLAREQRLSGPFLANEVVASLLRNLREDYLQDERQLMSLEFIDEVLAKADRLRPQLETALLSSRETEVLEKLLNGQSNKEIARNLELTENTVKFHLKKIFAKLKVKRRTQAIARARELGLLSGTEHRA